MNIIAALGTHPNGCEGFFFPLLLLTVLPYDVRNFINIVRIYVCKLVLSLQSNPFRRLYIFSKMLGLLIVFLETCYGIAFRAYRIFLNDDKFSSLKIN